MKTEICALAGIIGGAVASALGGWDQSLITLVIFMAVDYITGLIVAGIFHRSGKTESGALSSNVGFKGLIKKGVMLLVVLVAARLDLLLGVAFVRDAVIIAFILNELISIVENAGLMGVPIPPVIKKAIDMLQDNAGKDSASKLDRDKEVTEK